MVINLSRYQFGEEMWSKVEGRKSPDVRLQGLEYGYHAKTVIGNF